MKRDDAAERLAYGLNRRSNREISLGSRQHRGERSKAGAVIHGAPMYRCPRVSLPVYWTSIGHQSR
jgi:hypothetical protein